MNRQTSRPPRAAVNRLVRIGKVALASVSGLALIWGGALPAIAAGAPKLEADIVATTTATIVEAGENFVLEVLVSSDATDAPLPTGTVNLESEGSVVASGILADSEYAEGAETIILARPLATGVYSLVVSYSGDDNYLETRVAAPSFEVAAAAVALDLIFDTEPVVYGGSTTLVLATLTSQCTGDDPAGRWFCDGLFGSPSGMLTLKAVHPDSGEVMYTESRPVAGTPPFPEIWASPTADLTAAVAEHFYFEVPIPEILLGSPATWDFRASFVSNTWFADAGMMPRSAEVLASSTSVDLFVGDDLSSPVDHVAGAIQLTALVSSESYFSAPFRGTLNFYTNGELIAGQVLLDEESRAVITWKPTMSGTANLTAEFVPTTLNHIGSTSTTTTVTVALPKPAGEHKVEPADDRKLASTGAGDHANIAGATALALMLAGLALLGTRRLIRPNRP